MKTSYVVFFLFFSQIALGQLQENFDDGNFRSSPVWFGDTAFFKVNSSGELQSNGPAANSTLHLSTLQTQILNTQWIFYVRLEFDPSASNYAKVYLSSDQSGLKEPLNGYFVKIGGETGSTDGIDLYKQEGTVSSKLIDGVSGHAGKSINTLRIKVIRDLLGNWSLYSDTTGGYNFLPEGSAFDNSIETSSYFGISFLHSSTRKDLFYLDDIEIQEAPLKAMIAHAINDTLIEISFNKELDKPSAENPVNYWINNHERPLSATLNADLSKVRLSLANTLPYGSTVITINEIKDISGFFIDSNSTLFFNYKKSVHYGDLLITEIFADPSPSAGLPGEEFIELFNNTSDTLDLSGVTFSDDATSSILPIYKLAPSEYLILTNASIKEEFEEYGPVLGISPWPSLNNSGDNLMLKDDDGKTIFSVAYSLALYDDDEGKKEGGWSIEMINLKEFCAGSMNWKVSVDPAGGTPGKVNSVYSGLVDQSPPELIEVSILDSTQIVLKFNEPLDTLIQPSDFSIDLNISIRKAEIINSQTVNLTLLPSLKIKDLYHLSLVNVKDCKGNKIDLDQGVEFLLPEASDSLDIVINEVLFNPFTNGVDFVEIYNRSSKSVDLKNWEIGNLKSDTLSDRGKIFTSSYILHPNRYLCLTVNPLILESHYFLPYPERCIKMSRFPSYNDDMGTVLLIDSSGNCMDQFNYREDFHFSMIDSKEGISLERISFFAPTNSPHNWHSAAETAGWATPGYENSQHKEAEFPKAVSVEPKVFTPDQDAWKDFAFIKYQFGEPGYIGNITIYDVKGRAIKVLARNQLLAREGFFQWDGTNEQGMIADIGYYIVFFEAFNLKGEISGYKQTLVVARKF